MFLKHVTVAAHVAALVFQAGTLEVPLTIDDVCVRELSFPGWSVTPLWLR
jgi:hypothetical protein